MDASITIEIINKKGLHARAAAKFVKAVSNHNAEITVKKISGTGEDDIPEVGGSSILGLLMLGADPGSQLYITASGVHADICIAELKELIEARFGEPE